MDLPVALIEAIRVNPAAALICSDVDGTLAPIVELAADAQASPAAVVALSRVAALVGRVALITGRPAEVVLGMGPLADIPGLMIVGHYGLDRWYDGRLSSAPPDPAVTLARVELPELPTGAYVEDKGLSFVVHTRPAADPAAALEAVEPALRAIAERHGLDVVDGSFARELRPRGIDKGAVVAELAANAEVVIFLGDDDGDLPAAATLAKLRAEGVFTFLVCAERDGGSRALRDQADEVVAGVSGVVQWLDALADALAA